MQVDRQVRFGAPFTTLIFLTIFNYALKKL